MQYSDGAVYYSAGGGPENPPPGLFRVPLSRKKDDPLYSRVYLGDFPGTERSSFFEIPLNQGIFGNDVL